MPAPCSATSGRCISRSASAPASISPTAPTCCPITASSAPSRSSTASPARSAISATRHLANVRLHMGDALDVLERLPDASLRFVYLLHPDPWPKARHAKRRMVNHGPLDLIAAKLEPGGEFRLGTDDPVYCRWAMMVMGQRRDFEWLAESAARLPHPPRRLARDALRGQGPPRGPRGLVLPLPARASIRPCGRGPMATQHLPVADLRASAGRGPGQRPAPNAAGRCARSRNIARPRLGPARSAACSWSCCMGAITWTHAADPARSRRASVDGTHLHRHGRAGADASSTCSACVHRCFGAARDRQRRLHDRRPRRQSRAVHRSSRSALAADRCFAIGFVAIRATII